MEQNKILISSSNICPQIQEDETSLTVKFIINDFNTNENGKKVNELTAENWIHTLVSNPVVGKITITDGGEADFSQHNLYPTIRTDENGEPYLDSEFDTSAFGVFTSAGIEEINGKKYVVGTAKIWKRFPNFCSLIKKRAREGILATSYEIAVMQSHKELENGKEIEVIDDARFLGHCLLGKVVQPAYRDSQLVQVASQNGVDDFISALNMDIQNLDIYKSKSKEEILVAEKNKGTTAEDTKGTVNVVKSATSDSKGDTNAKVTTSALTEYDLRRELYKAIEGKLDCDWFYVLYHFPADKVIWVQKDGAKETEVVVFNYTVTDDIVTISEPEDMKLTVSVAEINSTVEKLNAEIKKKNSAILKTNEIMQNLKNEVASLSVYKEKFEIAEQEKIEKEQQSQRTELAEYALKSGYITKEEIETSEEIKGYIESLNKEKIQSVIADRVIASLDKNINDKSKKKIETSEFKVEKANLNNVEDVDYKSIIQNFIKK